MKRQPKKTNSQSKKANTKGINSKSTTKKKEPDSIQESLREYKQMEYKQVIEGTNNIVYIYSSKSGGIQYSSNLKSILGISKSALTKNPDLWNESIHEEDKTEVNNQLKKMKKNDVIELEYRFKKPNGKIIWLRDRLVCTKKTKNEVVVHGFASDITDYKNSIIELDKRNREYRLLFEEATDGILVGDTQGRIIDANANILKLCGYKMEELVGKHISKLFSPQQLKTNPLKFKEVLKGVEVRNERKIKRKDNKQIPIEMKSRILADGRLISFISDISERVEAEAALIKSEETYRSLIDEVIDSSSVGIFILDISFKVVWINNATEEFFGIKKSQVIGKIKRKLVKEKISKIFEDPQTFENKVLGTYKNNSYVERFECHILPKGRRKERWLMHWSQPIAKGKYKGGRIEHYTDITDSKEKEEALKKYANIIASNPDPISLLDKNYKYIIVNEAYEKFSGLKKEQIIGKSVADYLGKEVFKKSIKPKFDKCLNGDTISYQQWFDFKKIGKRFAAVTYWPYRNSKNEIVGIIASTKDITDRKIAEVKLQESEEKFRKAFENDIVGIAISQFEDGKYIDVNAGMEKITGYSKDQMVGHTTIELGLFNKNVRNKIREIFIETGRLNNFEYTFSDANGNNRTVLMSSSPILIYEQNCIVSSIVDITERKVAEDKLQESEARFRNMADTAPVLIWKSDITKECIFFNKVWLEFTGRTIEQELGNGWAEGVHPEDFEYCLKIYTENFDAKLPFKMEYRLKHNDGTYHWVYDHGVPRFTKDGEFLGFIGSCIDITKQKKAEAAISESEEKFRKTFETDVVGITISQFEDGKYIDVNAGMEKITGYSRDQFIGHTSIELGIIGKKDRQRFQELFIEAGRVNNFEHTLSDANGNYRTVLASSSAIVLNDCNCILSSMVDITERKVAQAKLELQSEILENMAEGACLVDSKNGDIIYTNTSYNALFGYDEGELVGKNISTINAHHTKTPEEVAFSIMKALKDNGAWAGEIHNIKKDGSTFWTYATVSTFKHPQLGEVWISAQSDISEIKKAQETLKQRDRIFNHSIDMLSIVGFDRYFKVINPAWSSALGWTDDELKQKPWIYFVHPDDATRTLEVEEIILNGKVIIQFENRYMCKDGSIKWLSWNAFPYEKDNEIFAVARDITSKKEEESRKLKETERLEILHDLYSKTSDMSLRELYDFALNKAIKLTESKIGFLHRVDEDQKSITLTTWSKETLMHCNALFDDHYPIERAGNWADSVRQKRPIAYNNYKDSANQKGLPKGHSPLVKFLSVPVFHENKVKYVFGVGNKEKDYSDHDILQLSLVANELSKIIGKRKADQELELTNARLKAAERIGNVGYYYFDIPLGDVVWSDETFRILDRDLSLGPPSVEEYYQNVHEDDLEYTIKIIEDAIINKTAFDFKYRIITPNNETKYLQSIGKAIVDENNEVTGVSGIIKDITIYQEALAEIKESQQKFEIAFKTSPDAVSITRISDGNYIDANDSFKRLLGYSREELIGHSSTELNIWRNNNDRKALIDALKKNGFIENLDAEFVSKQGKIVNGLMSARFVKIGGENVILSIIRDITERKKMASALEESEAKYRKLISNISDVIVIIDRAGNVIYKSPNITQHFGWTPEEQIGKSALSVIHPDDYERAKNELEVLLRNDNHKVTLELKYMCKDGSYKPIELTAVSLLNDPNINGVIANYKDISERKEAEKIIVETQRLGAIGEMSSAVAHDFNNSLQSIFGNLELALLNLDEDHPSKRFLETIRTATEDAATRVRLLQRFAGKSINRDEYSSVNINQILKDVVIQSRPIWKDDKEKDGLRISIDTDLGEIEPISGNEGELRSVFYNIIKNSVESMPNGGSILLKTFVKENDICLLLQDNGIGMDTETKSRIFQPFFTTKGFETGRGLGMSGAYSIIKEHGGKIYIQKSALGEGTTIAIEFPINKELLKAKLETEDKQKANISINILWVDDDKMIRDIVSELIPLIGNSGKVVSSGEEALKCLSEENFDLVITDIGMPGMNGWQLCKNIRALFGNKIKIAVSTGWGDQISDEVIEEHGVEQIISKPFSISQLSEIINTIAQSSSK